MHLRTMPSQKRRLSIAVFMRPDSAALNMGCMQMQPQIELFCLVGCVYAPGCFFIIGALMFISTLSSERAFPSSLV